MKYEYLPDRNMCDNTGQQSVDVPLHTEQTAVQNGQTEENRLAKIDPGNQLNKKVGQKNIIIFF